MSASIKFSVIIPTRERADTLVHCLRTVLTQSYDNLEIIVSDNFSQDNTKDVVASFSDKRIRYINTGKRISMSHNWEFALDHVKEGWVMFIGDDDGLYPWAIETLNKLIQRYNVETVFSAFNFFRWPGHFDEYPEGNLSVSLMGSAKLKSTRKELKRIFSGNSIKSRLPWLYAGGAASIDLINRTRDPNGRFFCSLNPDMYSAMALSFGTDKFLLIETPIAINGVSKHSNGTSSAFAKTDKELQPALKFLSEGIIPWHESLIIGKSFQMAWYEVYLQSWHIHKGELGISLADQLKVAARAPASGKILKDIIEQCQTIAVKHGLSFSYRGPTLKYRLFSCLDQLKRYFSVVNIDCKQLKIVNVYDAVMATAYIYNFLRQNFLLARLFFPLLLVTRAIFKFNKLFTKGD